MTLCGKGKGRGAAWWAGVMWGVGEATTSSRDPTRPARAHASNSECRTTPADACRLGWFKSDSCDSAMEMMMIGDYIIHAGAN